MNTALEFWKFELASLSNFSLNWLFLFFETNLPKRGASNRKQQWTKSGQRHWILHIWIRLATKFQLKFTILSFWTKFTQKGYFQFKTEKVNITIQFYKISAWTNNFDFLNQICLKKVLPVEKQKKWNHHWILHIWIILGTKFQPKLAVLIFWTKFDQEGIFQSKTEK